jgi:hypothetical protein
VTDEAALERAVELEDEECEELEADEVRPDGRSDAGDPWHGLNDFDDVR